MGEGRGPDALAGGDAVEGENGGVLEGVGDEVPVCEVGGLVDWDARVIGEGGDGHVVGVLYAEDGWVGVPSGDVLVSLS